MTVLFIVAILGVSFPLELIKEMEIEAHTPAAKAELRAAYGGIMTGFACIVLMVLRNPHLMRNLMGIFALMLGVFTSARFLSLYLDGTPNSVALVVLGVEFVGFILVAILYRSLPLELG